MLTITESAKTRIKSILNEKDNAELHLRTYVQGGGCNGLQYGFTLDENQNEDDHVIDLDTFSVLIDPMSMLYMEGSEIDYKDDLMSSQFIIKNPNAKSSCGCGSSFGV
jgi:iron-sulfur cluster insertion protein